MLCMDQEQLEMINRCKVSLTCKVYFTYRTYDPGDVLNQIGDDHALS